jgi:acyl dehydratase
MPVLNNPPFPHVYYEDFALDQVFEYGAHEMRADDIMRFAREFDPEPFHVSRESAAKTPLGRLIASGPHTCAVWRRINHDAFPHVRSGTSPGWDEVRWRAPVYPGDVLTCRTSMKNMRVLNSRPTMGFVTWMHEMRSRAGELKMTHTTMFLIERRPA